MRSYKAIFEHATLFLFVVLLCIISYFYFDIPLVEFAYDLKLRDFSTFFIDLTRIPEVVTVAMYCLVPVVIFISIIKHNIIYAKWFWVVLLIGLSLLAVVVTESVLEYVFGRYWPATWTNNNPSWLKDQVYGMNWFEGITTGIQAFPSGHTAVIFATATMLWKFYPKYLIIYILPCLLTVLGLVAMYYHWLSDIIFGAYLGYICAHMAYWFFMLINRKFNLKLIEKYRLTF